MVQKKRKTNLDSPPASLSALGFAALRWTYVLGTILLLCCAAGLLRSDTTGDTKRKIGDLKDLIVYLEMVV